ncbi:glutathione S-transferase family protein [Beijerinckia sp. L45]|uniref:glutathione S-transferase family protein n=1 Tax=Beijerinckia sp. L45 TaxID=1641855 RepID=UPI00131E92AA|nr:glutathione S-transferase family protein [Beijerinckia sp. L45]
MPPTLAIANKVYSSWSMRPWLLMRHFDIVFDEVVIPMDLDTSKAEMLRHAPTGKCPSLTDGDIVVWDSLAIIEYVAEVHPTLPIWPRDKAARAMARALAAEMHSGFMALRRSLPMNMKRSPATLRLDAEIQTAVDADVARIEAAWADARHRFGAGGPFLFGAFSAADAMFAPVVNRLQVYAVTVGPETSAYMAAVTSLQAWRDWQAEAEAEGWRLERIEAI